MALGIGNVTLSSLDLLQQSYRLPGVAPGAVPPRSRLGNGTVTDSDYKVADELIRAIPFVSVDARTKPFGKQHMLRADISGTNTLDLDSFIVQQASTASAGTGGNPWENGRTVAFGLGLTSASKRFKKISTLVRADELMIAGDDDMLQAQLRLASIAVVRTLSLGLFQGNAGEDNLEFGGFPSTTGITSDVYDGSKTLIWNLCRLEARCCPSLDFHGSRSP